MTAEANKTFLTTIGLVVRDAADMRDRDRRAYLKELLGKVQRREIRTIVGPDTAAAVDLTDDQWTRLEAAVRSALGAADAEGDHNA